MGQGESSFYPVHGHNVYLRENGSSVDRATDSRSHAIVFTKRQLVLNGLFQIKVLRKVENKRKTVPLQVVIGITTQNPANIRNLSSCSSLYELQHTVGDKNSDYWCVEFMSSIKSKSIASNYRQAKREITLMENDVAGLMLTKSGYVHLLVNGVDKEVLWNNLPTHLPLWGVLELTGVVTCIRAEYKNISSLTLQEDRSKLSPTPTSRPLPPLPALNNILVTSSLPVRSPSPKPPDPPPRSPTSLRRPLPDTPLSPPMSIQRAKTTLTLPNKKQRSLDTTQPIPLDDQKQLQVIHDQSLQIIRLEKEIDQQKAAKDDLQQQIDILRMQLVQRQKSPSLEAVHAETPPIIATPINASSINVTPISDPDVSFWEISSSDLEVNDEVLGRGGWGEVRSGSFRGTKVAVKKLYSEILSPHYVSLVKREISMMAKVRHPNLVLFIAAALDDQSGAPMIVLELLGESLRHAYQQNKLSSLTLKIHVLRDVAAALTYLHQHRQEIIHRDVSSGNVLVEALKDGLYKGKLSDFGSANLARLAVTAAPGAEVYTAPEVPRNTLKTSDNTTPQTTKIDVYSFGVLTCEVVSGQFPLRDVFQDMLQAVFEQSVIVRQIVDQCVESDPNNRPVMNTVLQQLNELLL